jgi:hypothetical protein
MAEVKRDSFRSKQRKNMALYADVREGESDAQREE